MELSNPSQYIEHTNLKPEATSEDMIKLVKEAAEYNFIGVCIPPFWIKMVKRELENTDIALVTVIGFPFGYQKTETKLTEINEAIQDGADELDIVLNVSSYKSGMNWPKIELAKCNQLIHSASKVSKVIVETGYLSKEEIIEVTKVVVDSGADYVKTSTGVLTTGAMLEDIKSMKKITQSNVGIKASGGIRTLEQLYSLVDAGACRIGTSAGPSIINECHHA